MIKTKKTAITAITTITAQEVKQLIITIYKKYKSGLITEQQAYKETYIINSLLKAIELNDYEERLQKIEELMKYG